MKKALEHVLEDFSELEKILAVVTFLLWRFPFARAELFDFQINGGTAAQIGLLGGVLGGHNVLRRTGPNIVVQCALTKFLGARLERVTVICVPIIRVHCLLSRWVSSHALNLSP